MFVPRQIKRKHTGSTSEDGSLAQRASKKLRLQFTPKSTSSGPRNTGVAPSVNYNAELVCGLDLILYQDGGWEAKEWLKERERIVDGKDGYIHLSAFLEHPVFARTKPTPTQKTLQRSFQVRPSKYFEPSPDGYYIRRLHTDQLSPDRDSRTIYVEPHLSSLAANPPALIHHLVQNSKMTAELYPVRGIESRHQAWAFITFSGRVDQELATAKDMWPADWIVMTKFVLVLFLLMPSAELGPTEPSTPAATQSTQHFSVTSFTLEPITRSPLLPNPTALPLLHQDQFQPFTAHTVAAYFAKFSKRVRPPVASGTDAANPQNLRISHVAYTPNTTTATVRAATAADAQLILTALAGRKRCMRSGSDGKGGVVAREKRRGEAEDKGEDIGEGDETRGKEDPKAVEAELLAGERERVFWEEVREGKRTGARRRRR
ncbi:MAG: hypothetical protein M1832_006273 [Thelocarpon impressellum]|nr:MAG: hypothetical protein M1832_006273 [Thelocarpon impressellum]